MSSYEDKIKEIKDRLQEIEEEKLRLKLEMVSAENEYYTEKMSSVEINAFNLFLYSKKNWVRSSRAEEFEEFVSGLRSIILSWDHKGKLEVAYNPWNSASTTTHEKEISQFAKHLPYSQLSFVASCYGAVESLEGKLISVFPKKDSKSESPLFLLIMPNGSGSLLKKRVSSQVHYEEVFREDRWEGIIPLIIFKYGRNNE